MKERSLGIILGILNIVLLTVCGIFFLGKDKNAPEILLPEGSIVYAEEAGTDSLVEGVTAFDEEDGELTDSVVIEKIVTNEAKETATITYGVADSSGNVGKVTCTVEMIVEDAGNVAEEANIQEAEDDILVTEEDTSLEKQAEDTDSDRKEEIAETEEEANDESGEDAETDDESREETEAEEESDEMNEEDENVDSQGEETTEEAQDEEDNREALPTAGEAGNASQNVVSRQEPGRPSIVFRKQEVYTTAGKDPAWVNVIEGLHDDKDNYETLLKSLKISGEYDRNTAGTYDITVTVKDSDGNESNSYPMKIIVEE